MKILWQLRRSKGQLHVIVGNKMALSMTKEVWIKLDCQHSRHIYLYRDNVSWT